MKTLKNIWDYIKQKFFIKDYKSSYNAISEANYLEQKLYKPKYTKLKQFVVSLTIYLLFLSLAFNIMTIRENVELKEHLAYVTDALIQLNEEQAEIQSQRDTPQKSNVKKSPKI